MILTLYGWQPPAAGCAHPELGNNAKLAALLGITVKGEIEAALVPWEALSMRCGAGTGASWIEARLGRKPLWCGDTGQKNVQRVAGVPAAGRGFQ